MQALTRFDADSDQSLSTDITCTCKVDGLFNVSAGAVAVTVKLGTSSLSSWFIRAACAAGERAVYVRVLPWA